MIQSQTSPVILTQSSARAITSKSKSNFSSSFFFLSREKRLAIQSVYAFFRVVDDVVDEENNPARQQELINYWKEEIHKLYTETATLPLLCELQKTVQHFKIPQDYFLKLVEGCEMDIGKKTYRTFDELYQYCYRVAGIVGLTCMKIFEYESPTADQMAINLGLALQLTNIIRDVGVDLEKGRVYLPEEDLKKFGLTTQDIFDRRHDETFIKLMDFEFDRALSYYQLSFEEFKKDKKGKLLAARIMGYVYQKILFKIKKHRYPVYDKKIKLNFCEKFFVLLKAFVSR
ncbi:MAG TPA: squalene synthase HpnD [Deltaproteobacteria bacterium]|nr:MAG: hypothetical protein A2048_02375 [Deltaproteobacteria bacterium GWA2_45_12]HBF12991.1 squalene synthase HpnD [Deltaproteobacteria bacterium]